MQAPSNNHIRACSRRTSALRVGAGTKYLEVAGGTLRVKAGAWYDESNAREAAEPLVPRIRQKMEAHGFTVVESKRTPGSSVTMLSLDPEGVVWPRDVVVERLRRALVARRSIAWLA